MMLRAFGIEASWKMSDPTVLTSVLMLAAMISAGYGATVASWI
jgi:hypothetical protein